MKKVFFLLGFVMTIYFNFNSAVEAEGKIINVTSYGVQTESLEDQTVKIQEAIKITQYNGDSLYFPAGTYNIQSNLELRNGGTIYGDSNGKTIFDGSAATKMIYLKRFSFAPLRKDIISDITFKNMGIFAKSATTYGINIENNIFYNGKYSTNEGDFYVEVQNTFNVSIKNNILLRGNGYAGRGIGTYGTTNAVIEKNFIGQIEDLPKACLLNSELSGKASLIQGKTIGAVNQELDLSGNQGNFVTGINSVDNDKNLKINYNFVSGNTSPSVYDKEGVRLVTYPQISDIKNRYRRDHVVYAKGYEKLTIVGNYFSGWTNDSAGGIKIRNGSQLFIGSNYLNSVPLLTYVYKDMPSKLKLSETYIYNNLYYSIYSNETDRTAFLYWQDFVELPNNKVSLLNNVYYKNKVMTSERDSKTVDNFTFQPKDNESIKEFYWSENKYVANGGKVMIKFNALNVSDETIDSGLAEEKIQSAFGDFLAEYKQTEVPFSSVNEIQPYTFGDERIKIHLPSNIKKVKVFINGVKLDRGVINNEIFEAHIKDKVFSKKDSVTIIPVGENDLEGDSYPIKIN